jgi:serine/threonine-protein kinase
VKIIDFGVAHMVDTRTTRSQKGTLIYMSPEQIELKPLSALSDIFSLSVVCYEALTGRQPFQRARADEIVDAILHQIPPPASELNPAVNQAISRVVHKGMAKQSWHRFSSAREFGDTLNKALRGEAIEFFDPSRTRPRVERATKALQEGDYQFAGEILGELEAEGHLDTSIATLRQQLDGAVRRKTIAQLLEAAKARFEEEEDPLALQKLQEVLQMEADNATALSLKSKIENRRSTRQIDNWYKLARQHMDNHAYPHAREALQNVLQLRPNETRALQLIAEVDREEQEYNKLRQEKAQLHRAAMEAWQKGDVSSALMKLGVVLELDRKAPDSSVTDSAGTYQSFYNQVRSEHDAMNAAYAEARKHLAERNFSKALALCGTYLGKYPNNALFQALKYDIEEQQRQQLSAFIAEVDRQVEGEADLDKRVNILQEALTQHPGESHFERALRLVQDKRDLVNSIVARAHLHEEQGAFGDALNDWEILRTIYSQYPGLKFEVERLQKRREQQARIEAKTSLVEQVDACMHASDYARALDLLEKGKLEFPNDTELTQLEELANEGVQRKSEAHRLMTEGQELCTQGRFVDGSKLLRQAYELDENNAMTRAVLSNALIEQAQRVVDSNWQEAERLAQQSLDLNPSHPMAKTIRSLIQDQKREQVVNDSVSQARKLQAGGEVAGALARITEALSAYPREARLLQIQDTLQREVESQRRQTRRRDLDELRSMEHEAASATDPAMKQTFGERVQTLAEKYTDDEEVLAVADGLLQRLNLPKTRRPTAGAGADKAKEEKAASTPAGEAETVTMSLYSAATVAVPLPPAEKAEPAESAATPPAVPGTAATQPKPPSTVKPARPATPPLSRQVKIVGAAAGVILLLVVSWLGMRHGRQASAPAPSTLSVTFHTSPAGATIRINNEARGVSDMTLDLPQGAYQVEALLDGYQAATASLEVKPGSPNSLEMTLQPALPSVRLSSDTGTGKVSFDDDQPVDLEGALWTLDKVTEGDHTLKFDGPQGSASLSFAVAPLTLPVVKGPVVANGVLAVAVSNLGGHLHIYCSDPGAKLSLDGQAAADATQDGVDLTQLSPGTHQLTVFQGSDQYKMDVDAGPMPTLTTLLQSGGNIGTLVVATGEDRVRVFVNGQLQKQTTQGGQLRIPNLEPKDYVVRVAKNGFQDVPEQRVKIRKGEQSKLAFTLQAIPKLASLAIQNAVPGTEVVIDQQPVGTVNPDGTFNFASVSPGDHVIELRKDRFNPKRLQKHFVAGATVPVVGSEAALEVAAGEVRITFTPADATVTLTKAGQLPVRVTSGNPLSLPPGSYTLTAKTAEGVSRTSTVEVAAGESKSIDLPLGPSGMTKWDDASGWKSEKNWFVHRGGDFVLYSSSPTSGSFTFTAMLMKGKRLQWVLNYVDSSNYGLLQMDENYFYRSVVRNGQKTDAAKIPHKWDKKTFCTIQIRVTPTEIVHQVREKDAWVALDTWNQPGANLSLGKFGFYIPGNDQVALSNFNHYEDLKPR